MADFRNPAEILREAAELFETRNPEYGNTWVMTGDVMKALFPDGINLQTAHDFSKFNTLQLMVLKLMRICAHFHDDNGHPDSIADLQVYTAMLGSKFEFEFEDLD